MSKMQEKSSRAAKQKKGKCALQILWFTDTTMPEKKFLIKSAWEK